MTRKSVHRTRIIVLPDRALRLEEPPMLLANTHDALLAKLLDFSP